MWLGGVRGIIDTWKRHWKTQQKMQISSRRNKSTESWNTEAENRNRQVMESDGEQRKEDKTSDWADSPSSTPS